MNLFSRKQKDSVDMDLREFFESLSFVRPGRNGYSKRDRYAEFNTVFGTPEGQRVLAQIIDYAEGLPVLEEDLSEVNRLIFRAGRRDCGLWIIKIMNSTPLGEMSNE